MEIEFRRAEMNDLEVLTYIYNQAILCGKCTCDMKPFTWQQRVDWFNSHLNDRYPMYVCLADETIVGYAHFSPFKEREALNDVTEITYYLDFAYHKMGIGTKIMQMMLERAKEIGFTDIMAVVVGCNEGSMALLKKFGFREWGRLPQIAHFGERKEDHVYFGLKLSETEGIGD